MGEWKTIGNPCRGMDADKTFYRQSTFVLPVQGKDNIFIAMFDCWNKTNLEDSRYIWLPIVEQEDGSLIVSWHEQWDWSFLKDK